MNIYSYVVRHDAGSAPNPFWGMCSLAICKPPIRRNAQVGDWLIGTGSKQSEINKGVKVDLSNSVVYAMQVTQKVDFNGYNKLCETKLKRKIPEWKTKDWRRRVGDCLYYDVENDTAQMRVGVHNSTHMQHDLGGQFVLLSDHFFYFGRSPKLLPEHLKFIKKKGPGYRKVVHPHECEMVLNWLDQFTPNKIYDDPQLVWRFKREEEKKSC